MIVFLLANLAPGDPIDAMINPEMGATLQDFEALREALGLNKPLPVRYVLWLRELARGNLGYSYSTHRPVGERIGGRIGPTLVLMGVALITSTLLGIFLGAVSALWPYSLLDYVVTVFAFSGVSMPDFFFGLLLMFLFALKLRLLPSFGMVTPGVPPSLVDYLKHLIMPAMVLALGLIGNITRFTRASMLEVLHADYVTVARAKGLMERVVILRHAFKNALLPLITVLGMRLSWLFSGAVIVETIFSWPGMGLLAMESIRARDYTMIMGVSLVTSVAVLGANLGADIAYAIADPRIRYE